MFGRRETLIFDGNDTLWKTQEIYRRAEVLFLVRMRELGFDPDDVYQKFDEIKRGLEEPLGLSEERYPRAMVGTYTDFVNQRGEQPDPEQEKAIQTIGKSVFTTLPKPMDGAYEVLSMLAPNYQLVFYSAGDEEIQKRRLRHLLGSDDNVIKIFSGGTYVVERKNEAHLRKIIADLSLRKQNTWVIGNSPRFDINPALSLELNCIWVYSELWEGDVEEFAYTGFPIVFSLTPIPTILHRASRGWGWGRR